MFVLDFLTGEETVPSSEENKREGSVLPQHMNAPSPPTRGREQTQMSRGEPTQNQNSRKKT